MQKFGAIRKEGDHLCIYGADHRSFWRVTPSTSVCCENVELLTFQDSSIRSIAHMGPNVFLVENDITGISIYQSSTNFLMKYILSENLQEEYNDSYAPRFLTDWGVFILQGRDLVQKELKLSSDITITPHIIHGVSVVSTGVDDHCHFKTVGTFKLNAQVRVDSLALIQNTFWVMQVKENLFNIQGFDWVTRESVANFGGRINGARFNFVALNNAFLLIISRPTMPSDEWRVYKFDSETKRMSFAIIESPPRLEHPDVVCADDDLSFWSVVGFPDAVLSRYTITVPHWHPMDV